MKTTHIPNQQETKKFSWFRYTLLCVFLLTIASGAVYLKSNKSQQNILAKLTHQNVAPSAWPALIYEHKTKESPGVFTATGTVLDQMDKSPILISAEHVFRTDYPRDRILSVKVLRAEELPIFYVHEILGTSKTLNGGDLVTFRLGTKPTIVKPFSTYHKAEGGFNSWAPVEISGDKIEWMVSILSGEKVKTIGYHRQVVGDQSNNFVLIDYLVRPDESGTGFVDSKGGLWVVHGMPFDRKISAQLAEECYRKTGKRIQYPCAVSGPLGGRYTNNSPVSSINLSRL